jgi:hypothetical protein
MVGGWVVMCAASRHSAYCIGGWVVPRIWKLANLLLPQEFEPRTGQTVVTRYIGPSGKDCFPLFFTSFIDILFGIEKHPLSDM